MSRKPVVNSYEMFTGLKASNGQVSPSVDATILQISKLTNVTPADSATIHINFSAPNTGEITVQARNIEVGPNEPDRGWYNLSFGAPTIITNESDAQVLLNSLPFYEIRIMWTPTVGAGTISAFLNTKVSGA